MKEDKLIKAMNKAEETRDYILKKLRPGVGLYDLLVSTIFNMPWGIYQIVDTDIVRYTINGFDIVEISKIDGEYVINNLFKEAVDQICQRKALSTIEQGVLI